ncbi:MAG: endonuclease V [Candidatus Calescibacterium sp.]|nr:endonuclease V [Candidatus Calescibacterium sp.]
MKVNKINIQKLKSIQFEISKSVYLPSEFFHLDYFQFLVGIDLAFIGCTGIASFAVFDTLKKEISYFYEISEVNFPYIPSFLAFRELPLINKLYERMKSDFLGNRSNRSLFFIDGHGLSHPRKAGIATHFGVVNNNVSIGIAKKLLYGKFKEPYFLDNHNIHISEVIDEGSYPIAFAVKTSYLGRKDIMGTKTLFISVGNNINLDNSLELFLDIYRNYGFVLTELAHNYLQKIKKKI